MFFLLFVTFFCTCAGFNESPKIYNQMEAIEFVDALRHGFVVHLPKKLVDTQLDVEKIPVIYVTAVPLKKELPSYRDVLYKIHDYQIQIVNLTSQHWYYVCVEFENQHRTQRMGNVSTSCGIYRTLDKFGAKGESIVQDMKLVSTQDNSISVQAEVDCNFPVRLDFYLAGGPLVQSYLLNQGRSLLVVFSDLVPGYDYGEVCVRQAPLVNAYTSMGRDIHAALSKCFLGSLRTHDYQTFPPESHPNSVRTQLHKRSALTSAAVRCDFVSTKSFLFAFASFCAVMLYL